MSDHDVTRCPRLKRSLRLYSTFFLYLSHTQRTSNQLFRRQPSHYSGHVFEVRYSHFSSCPCPVCIRRGTWSPDSSHTATNSRQRRRSHPLRSNHFLCSLPSSSLALSTAYPSCTILTSIRYATSTMGSANTPIPPQ